MTLSLDAERPHGGDLFGSDPTANLLPCDGTVNYFGSVLSATEADRLFEAMRTRIPWKSDELVLFGRRIVTSRQVVWFGDAGCSYTYSGTTKEAQPWNAELQELKELAERLTKTSYNSCLANLYHHGGEGMAWHSDDEKELGRNPTIASLSFGAERKFSFKHKRTQETVSLTLGHGSLLVMREATQHHWLHSLPKSKKIDASRINLTFRTILI
jgi:alkylated DNA repair dioxygenase AlkB